MNSNNTQILFGLNAAVHLLSIILEIEWLTMATKPLLMILLALYFHYAVERNGFTEWIMFALIFSFGGDVALMFQSNPLFFILGLGSFLIGHLCYAYGMLQFPHFDKGILKRKWWLAIPLLAYGVGLVYFLWSGLGDMMIPVVVYSVVIMLMGLSAIQMMGRTTKEAAAYIVIGALLFILSDSVIAINKFQSNQLSIPNPSLVIMTTYIAGQYLIIKGVVKANHHNI